MLAGWVVLQGSDIELQLVLLDTIQLCGDSGTIISTHSHKVNCYITIAKAELY